MSYTEAKKEAIDVVAKKLKEPRPFVEGVASRYDADLRRSTVDAGKGFQTAQGLAEALQAGVQAVVPGCHVEAVVDMHKRYVYGRLPEDQPKEVRIVLRYVRMRDDTFKAKRLPDWQILKDAGTPYIGGEAQIEVKPITKSALEKGLKDGTIEQIDGVLGVETYVSVPTKKGDERTIYIQLAGAALKEAIKAGDVEERVLSSGEKIYTVPVIRGAGDAYDVDDFAANRITYIPFFIQAPVRKGRRPIWTSPDKLPKRLLACPGVSQSPNVLKSLMGKARAEASPWFDENGVVSGSPQEVYDGLIEWFKENAKRPMASYMSFRG